MEIDYLAHRFRICHVQLVTPPRGRRYIVPSDRLGRSLCAGSWRPNVVFHNARQLTAIPVAGEEVAEELGRNDDTVPPARSRRL